jgi:hypothetical protein
MSYAILSERLIASSRRARIVTTSDRGCVGSHPSIAQLVAEDSTEHRNG